MRSIALAFSCVFMILLDKSGNSLICLKMTLMPEV